MRLVRSLVNGLIVLHDNNFKNVYLHKEAVVITSENAYKLLDTQLCNRIHPFFEILNGVPPKNATYLAPELLAVNIILSRISGEEAQITTTVPKQISLPLECCSYNWPL